MLVLVKLSTIFLILSVLCCDTRGRPAQENAFKRDENYTPLQVSQKAAAAAATAGGSRRTAASRIGSHPPSCVNKCDSCTPCQAVQASQQSLADMSSNIGSRPPSCQNKCNRCIPCQAVQVPTPIERKSGQHGKAPRESRSPRQQQEQHQHRQEQDRQKVSVEYSNYKPEGWRCKCGNKLFNP